MIQQQIVARKLATLKEASQRVLLISLGTYLPASKFTKGLSESMVLIMKLLRNGSI
jgi:hypothetical protein